MLSVGAGAMTLGWDSPVIGSLSLGVMLIIAGVCLLVGAILWASRAGQLKDFGRVLTVLSLAVIVIMVIALAVKPAEIAPAPSAGTFKVLSVTGLVGATFSEPNRIFTVAMNVNTTAHTTTVSQLAANFSVQRTDAGLSTTDIKTVSAGVAQSSQTDTNTGLTYNTLAPNKYGEPKVNWTLDPGAVAVTYSLTAQLGLTPYESGAFSLTMDFNAQAFTTSQVTANDIIYAGSITVAGVVYSINVVIGTVST